jgi:hypothetical protein
MRLGGQCVANIDLLLDTHQPTSLVRCVQLQIRLEDIGDTLLFPIHQYKAEFSNIREREIVVVCKTNSS